MQRTFVGLAVSLAAILAMGCAGASANAAKPGPRGEIVLFVNDYGYRGAAFDDKTIGVGNVGGPSFSTLTLTPGGTWKGQVASFSSGGDPAEFYFKRAYVGKPTYPTSLIELEVVGSRITGIGTDVTFTRVDGGFRITGLWLKKNVDLTVTRTSARSQQITYTRKENGRYEAQTTPPLAVQVAGEAANPEDFPFPQGALAALAMGWGVHPFP